MKKIVMTSIVLFVFSICSASAADKTKDQKRTKDRKKDGSCVELINPSPVDTNAAYIFFTAKQSRKGGGDRDQDRDRLKDGSCLDNAAAGTADIILAATQDRDREKDKKKDGTCSS